MRSSQTASKIISGALNCLNTAGLALNQMKVIGKPSKSLLLSRGQKIQRWILILSFEACRANLVMVKKLGLETIQQWTPGRRNLCASEMTYFRSITKPPCTSCLRSIRAQTVLIWEQLDKSTTAVATLFSPAAAQLLSTGCYGTRGAAQGSVLRSCPAMGWDFFRPRRCPGSHTDRTNISLSKMY